MHADDQILVDRYQAGDEKAFTELVLKYQRKVYMMVYGMVSNHQDAKELTQEVFLRVYKHLKNFEGTSSFYTWLYRITRNLCIDYYRRRKVRTSEFNDGLRNASAREEQIFPVVSSASRETPTGRLLKEELAQQIREAMDKLPPKHREILILRELEGLAYQEIADTLGISIGTVMSRLHHARKKMQKRLAPYLRANS